MKSYVVLKREWESVDILYCGTDEQKANSILDDGDHAHNNVMEVWEDGKHIKNKTGTYKFDVEEEY